MPHAQRHRGAHPEDERLFADKVLPRLRAAATEITYLLSRGYPPDPALTFVCGHYQLDARQRIAVRRCVCSEAQRTGRARRLLPLPQAAGGPVVIDGFNLIITLEVALSGGVLLLGADGALRDLAGLRGSYHPVAETEAALALLGRGLGTLAVPAVRILLDAPVANSGRLRARILAHAATWSLPVEVELLADVDGALTGAARVVSSDAAVLDACASWLNLAPWLVAQVAGERPWRLVTLQDEGGSRGRAG